MEIVQINKEILDQMDRQLNFSYAFAAIIVTLAVVVVGYQLTINRKIIKELKEDNQRLIQNVSAPIFEISISQMIRMGFYGINDVEELCKIYSDNFQGNESTRKSMETLKIRFIRNLKQRITSLAPIESQASLDENLNKDFETILNSVEEEIKSAENFSKEEKENRLYTMRDIYSKYVYTKVLFKNI